MKLALDIKRFRFYLGVGAAYLSLWLFVDLVSHPEAFRLWASNEFWRALYIVIVNILFFEYTLPRLSRKRIFRSAFLALGQFFLYSFGLYGWRYLGIQLGVHTAFKTYSSFPEGVGDQFGAGVFSVLFFGIIKHIYDYRKLKEAAQLLRIEKQEAELNYLKSQTNPHFLFNTLNNIYVLARDKSELAPESILRLSKILRFMLYEAGGAYIAIEQELKIISDYIALEQLRYDTSLHVSFNYDVEDIRQALPPLLLVPLVENAFKHGVSETRNQPFLDIHLSLKQRQLEFYVKNSTETVLAERHVKENIGLSNLRRQLELLYKDYSLSVHQAETVFTATLKINLSSHV
ncbi:sensor histidine kinase [Pontibacter toksunensis]|uniref:Sensor histidine kinase n=1 Tax=Pontibacter toksunensis TaxID=1332631 RepID=A0ABW6BUN2_9BACT